MCQSLTDQKGMIHAFQENCYMMMQKQIEELSHQILSLQQQKEELQQTIHS